MAISFDAGVGQFNASGSPTNLAHTIAAGSDRYLLVGISVDSSVTVSSVAWNTSESMTLVDGPRIHNSGANNNYVYGLIAPSTGTHNVTVTFSGSSGSSAVSAVSLTGVDQTVPIGTFAADGDASGLTVLTASPESAVGDLIIEFCGWRTNGTTWASFGAGETGNFTEVPGGPRMVSSRKNGAAGTTTVTANFNSALASGYMQAVAVHPSAGTAVAHVATTVGFQAGVGTDLTFAHNNGAGDGLIVLIQGYGSSSDFCNAVTYNGAALARQVREVYSGDPNLQSFIYSMAGPAANSNNVVVDITATLDQLRVFARSFSGVDQTTPVSGATSAEGSSGTSSVVVSSAANDMVVAISYADATTQTMGAGQANDSSELTGSDSAYSSTEVGAASVTMTYDFASGIWIIAGINVKAAAADVVIDNVPPARRRMNLWAYNR